MEENVNERVNPEGIESEMAESPEVSEVSDREGLEKLANGSAGELQREGKQAIETGDMALRQEVEFMGGTEQDRVEGEAVIAPIQEEIQQTAREGAEKIKNALHGKDLGEVPEPIAEEKPEEKTFPIAVKPLEGTLEKADEPEQKDNTIDAEFHVVKESPQEAQVLPNEELKLKEEESADEEPEDEEEEREEEEREEEEEEEEPEDEEDDDDDANEGEPEEKAQEKDENNEEQEKTKAPEEKKGGSDKTSYQQTIKNITGSKAWEKIDSGIGYAASIGDKQTKFLAGAAAGGIGGGIWGFGKGIGKFSKALFKATFGGSGKIIKKALDYVGLGPFSEGVGQGYKITRETFKDKDKRER